MARRRSLHPAGRALCALAAACAAGPAAAQAGWRVQPTLAVSQLVTDNADLSASARRAEAVTQLSPGLRVSGRSARLSGEFDYTLNALAYARRDQDNQLQHALRAAGRLEAVENHLFVSAAATLGQQAVSAFAAPLPDERLASPNRRQVATVSVSPSLVGRIGDLDASAVGNVLRTRVQNSVLGDSGTESLALSLANRRGRLGWVLDARYGHAAFAGGIDSETLRAGATVIWRPDVDWRLSLRGGWESDTGLGGARASSSTWGAGFGWAPSPRTSVDVNLDDRVFGRAWNISAQHRFRRASIRLTETRGDSSGLAVTPGRRTTAYDLLFEQFASIEPDPVRREALVRSFLANNGLDPNAGVVVGGGFLSATRTLDHRQELGLSWTGVRSSLTGVLWRSDSRRLGPTAGGGDLAVVGRVRQEAYSLTATHSLTANLRLVLGASGVLTLGEGSLPGSSYRLFSAGLSMPLGRNTSASLSLRHTRGDRATGAYEETAATAVLGLRF